MSSSPRPRYEAAEVRGRLNDPRRLCALLGLLDRHERQANGGVTILCPFRAERSPSCSVTLGPDRTVRFHCFGCDQSGDALHLVAVTMGLDARQDFVAVLERAAQLAGVSPTEEPADSWHARPPLPPAAAPSRSYPLAAQVERLWASCRPVIEDDEVASYLAGRAIPPETVADLDLARALPPDVTAPPWAHCGGAWGARSYRLILPMCDAVGALRSVRARRVVHGEGAKAVAPAGLRADKLVMACPVARSMLATGKIPAWHWGIFSVVIEEGEPDFLTVASLPEADDRPPAVLGITSSSWSSELADRIPDGARVLIRTHADEAGDKYAAQIRASLEDRLVEVFDRVHRVASRTR